MIIDISKNLEEIVKKYDLKDIADIKKQEFAISSTTELQNAIQKMEDESRVLKIGLIGRVKAGKSSLLNSLIFDGEDILPKAATPMTASLTVIGYSKTPYAKIEFFSKEDISNIKKDYEYYLQEFENIKQKEIEELTTKYKQRNKGISSSEIEEKATKKAKRVLKENEIVKASYEQYNKIKELNISFDELDKFRDIDAKDKDELLSKLQDFVGANGRYMPFTKAVCLYLNEQNLEGIEIVDTPGFNDPVISREERTKELLKYCDVVFILSPSGQFLTNEDIKLFDRVRGKEGVNEIRIIASQVDNQLFGSEKDEDLNNSLNSIIKNLTSQMREIFANDEYLNNNPSLQKMLNNDVLYSSAISYSIHKKLTTTQKLEKLDSMEQHILTLLRENYPNNFSIDTITFSTLEMLSNISSIKKLIDEVRAKKNQILKEKKENFISTKLKAILEYKGSLVEDISNKLDKIKTTDIEKIKAEKEKLQTIKIKGTNAINNEYSDIVESLNLELQSSLIDELNLYFKQTRKDLQEGEEIQTTQKEKSYTVDKGSGLLWWRSLTGTRYETKTKMVTEQYTVAKAGFIRNSLEDLTDSIENIITLQSKEYIVNWRKKTLSKQIIRTLRDTAGDDNIDINAIFLTIKKVTNSIVLPDISYSGQLPDILKQGGTLKSSEAERFLNEANSYVNDLKSRVKNDIINYINSLVSKLNEVDIAKSIFESYDKELEELSNSIKNKELFIQRYTNILNELKKVGE